MKKLISIIVLSLIIFGITGFSNTKRTTLKSGLNILVFTKTVGFRHNSIPEGIKSLRQISDEQLWQMTATEDASFFNKDYLKNIDVVVFLNTTGDVLNSNQEKAFENFIKSGGGFVGIHAAADTEFDWVFYHDLVGAQFDNHPHTQEARLKVHHNTNHPALNSLGDEWTTTDEWYYFKNPIKSHINVILELDESTIEGSASTGKPHPMAWYHDKLGGRAFYTGLGHTNEQYANPVFKEHLKLGLLWAGKKFNIQEPTEWTNLLDEDLSLWDKYMGVPHKSVSLPFEFPKSDDVRKGKPLGLNNDPLNVFSVKKDKNEEPILTITGEIYGGLTTKKMYQNYHFKCQFKWGEKKWEPRLDVQRDNGLLFHATGGHAAFWHVWMRSLECQVQERDFGDFFPLSGTIADITVANVPDGNGFIYDPKGVKVPASFTGRHIGGHVRPSKDMEKPHGEWNTIEIYTVGDKAVFVVNGEVVNVLSNTRYLEGNLEIPIRGGFFQIQSEGAEAYYKSMQIRGINKFPQEILTITEW